MRRQPRTVTIALTALLALSGIGATSAAAETGTAAEVAAVGGRLINGDGDTSGECLEISGSGTTHRIQMGTCHVNAHAGWTFQSIGSGYFTIRSHDTADSSGRCLTGYNQAQAMMLPCDGIDDQEWSQIPAPNNWFMLKNRFHGTCLDVKDHGTSNVVWTFPCGDPANAGPQKWHWHSV